VSEAENIAAVERFLDAWNANDWPTMERLVDPSVTVTAPEGWPETGRLEGWPAVRVQLERLKEPWSEERIELVRARGNGDKVLAETLWLGKGESSGVEIEMETYAVYTIHDDRCTDAFFSLDLPSALAAAGIEDPG
jgi:ketosteroid isomerase-like protein